MTPRAIGGTIVVAIILAMLASLALGTIIGPIIAVSLVAGAVIGLRVASRITRIHASRALARGSALALVFLAIVLRTVLVRNPSDNAYLWIAVVGMALLLPAVPFALAGLLPRGPATSWLMRAGIVLLWLLAVPGLVLLVIGAGLSVATAPPSIPMDTQVPLSHLLAFVLLAGTLYLVGFYWPRIPPPD